MIHYKPYSVYTATDSELWICLRCRARGSLGARDGAAWALMMKLKNYKTHKIKNIKIFIYSSNTFHNTLWFDIEGYCYEENDDIYPGFTIEHHLTNYGHMTNLLKHY